MQRLIRYIKGYLKIRVEGMYVERFLNMCSHHHIDLWSLKPVKHNYEMKISVMGFRKLKPIIRKTESKVAILEKHGLPFFIYKYRKRSLFLLSLFLSIFLLYVSTFFVSQINISGNVQYSEDVILESLHRLEIHTGIRKERINCEAVSQFLRKEFENITWASVYVSGTKLFIKIKEKEEEKELIEVYDMEKVNHLVADTTGYVTSIITRKGIPKVHVGDYVKKGDILVSGEIELKNDAGEVIAFQYVIPEAEIRIKTIIEYEDTLSLNYYKKYYTNQAQKLLCIELEDSVHYIGVRLGNEITRTSFYKEIFDIGSARIGILQEREYEMIQEKYSKKEYKNILNKNYMKFCEKIEKKGVQILENNVKIYSDSYCAFAKGKICVSQKAGIIRAEEKRN